MPFEQRSLDDYIDVAQRIADFRERFPDGSLQAYEPWKFVMVQGFEKNGDVAQQTFICYTAAAYRTPDDPRPGIGVAWEVFPGRTPYTRGSELQNAETSAWGRAIIAVGASDSKRGIASREEVRNRQAERDDGLPVNADGSLSRSRTSDVEKAAAGVMTDPQQRAHNALRRDGSPKPGSVEILGTTPVDDAWYDNPAPLADLQNPEDLHGTATADQIRSLHARMAATKGFSGPGMPTTAVRDGKLRWLQERFGPDIRSSKDLSYTQAAQALQELTR